MPDTWVVKPWSATHPYVTEEEADGWFVQNSRLGDATDPFAKRKDAEAEARRRNDKKGSADA